MNNYLREFQEFLLRNDIQQFTAQEVLYPGGLPWATEKFPKAELWPNIIPVLKLLEMFTNQTSARIRVLSVFRPEVDQYNHYLFDAVDFEVDEKDQGKLQALRKMRDDGLFKGGLDIHATRVHIDTRGENKDF